MSDVQTVLVDRRNYLAVLPIVKAKLAEATVYGLDCETEDSRRHAGLEVYNTAIRHVFDHRRTTMTGFSIYIEGDTVAYYFNLAHADVENRLPPEIVHEVLNAVSKSAIGVAHNLPFELVMFRQCHGIELQNFVCTLQMAVSHHSPDEYDLNVFDRTPLPKAFHKLAYQIIEAWEGFEQGSRPSGRQQELLGKFIAKESSAEHSYNGFVKSIAKGYSLKNLTKSRFGVNQTTFKEVLGGAKHMGELLGERVAAYGADDAYWAVKHYRWMFEDMLRYNPHALNAFFQTENRMVYQYADAWREGIRLDLTQVFERRDIERQNMAAALREFKAQLRAALPFPAEPHPKLMEKEISWYPKGWQRKRKQIEDWINTPDAADDFEQCFQVSNPIGNAWANERNLKVPSGKLNLVHYHGMRTIMYDLLRLPIQYDEGSVASDKEARGRIREKLEAQLPTSSTPMDVDSPEHLKLKNCMAAMGSLQTMADIEQRMKLYLTPYTQLIDPETSRVYPSLSSQLATRRLATSFPNPMQLAKSGDSAYIRSFYLGDTDDHVVVSADWSAIELVLIGDQSGDPGFAEVYGQLPYGDMHSGAAVDALSVKTLPGLTEEEFREFKFGRNPNNRVLRDFSGRDLSPSDYHKFTRGTAVGKGVNFSYWYSGALSTVANNLSLTDEEHWTLVENYRNRFPIAEAWRVGVQDEAAINGFIVLPDGHRRTKYECTRWWADSMRQKFLNLSASPALVAYSEVAIRRLQGRARNQVVNAMIQGSCATLAKRTLLKLAERCKGQPYRLMMPIHDELVFSVHKDYVIEFIKHLRWAMTDHKDIVKTLPLNCTVAIGRTFRPFNKADPRLSQIELDEAQKIEGVIPEELEGKALNDDQIGQVLEYMFA